MKFLDKRLDELDAKVEKLLDLVQSLVEENNSDRSITVHEAAVMLGCSDQRVRDLINEGAIPAHRDGRAYKLSYKHISQLAGYDNSNN